MKSPLGTSLNSIMTVSTQPYSTSRSKTFRIQRQRIPFSAPFLLRRLSLIHPLLRRIPACTRLWWQAARTRLQSVVGMLLFASRVLHFCKMVVALERAIENIYILLASWTQEQCKLDRSLPLFVIAGLSCKRRSNPRGNFFLIYHEFDLASRYCFTFENKCSATPGQGSGCTSRQRI